MRGISDQFSVTGIWLVTHENVASHAPAPAIPVQATSHGEKLNAATASAMK